MNTSIILQLCFFTLLVQCKKYVGKDKHGKHFVLSTKHRKNPDELTKLHKKRFLRRDKDRNHDRRLKDGMEKHSKEAWNSDQDYQYVNIKSISPNPNTTVKVKETGMNI